MKTNSASCAKSWLRTRGSLAQCLLLVTFLLMLSGCSTPSVRPDDLPPIPANLLQQCREPLALKDGRPQTAVNVLTQDAEDLLQCFTRHKALVEVVKFREQLYNQHKED